MSMRSLRIGLGVPIASLPKDLHEYIISGNYEEVEAFYGEGKFHLHGRDGTSDLINALSFVERTYGTTDGIIILPTEITPESEASKYAEDNLHGMAAVYTIYMPKNNQQKRAT